MIVKQGNILNSPAQTLVNPVNCVGVMGKGLALQFRRRFPSMFRDYVKRCQQGEVRIGEPYLYRGKFLWILNFPTKVHWRNPSQLEYIVEGLNHFRLKYRQWGVESVAFPALGCGCGNLNWEQVLPVMESILGEIEDIRVEIYAPRVRAGKGIPRRC